MNRLPSNLIGHEVFVILNSGEELEGLCIQAGDSYLILRIGTWWEYTVEADAIAAIGVDREGKAYGGYPLLEKEVKEFEIGQRVRIVGPTTDGHAVYIGKCFYIDRIIGPPHQQQKEYSRKDCGCIFTASSLEPVERDPDRLEAIERRLDSIEKRLQPMEDKVVIKITERLRGADA